MKFSKVTNMKISFAISIRDSPFSTFFREQFLLSTLRGRGHSRMPLFKYVTCWHPLCVRLLPYLSRFGKFGF